MRNIIYILLLLRETLKMIINCVFYLLFPSSVMRLIRV